MQFKSVLFASFLTVLAQRFVVVVAKPSGSAQIVRYENMQAEDNYKFDFHTSDGQRREESGVLVNGGQELVVRGSYSYTGPDNKVYRVEYVADRNGFQPKVIIQSAAAAVVVEESANNDADDDEDAQIDKKVPGVGGISTAAYDPNSEIRPHTLKSLLG